MKPFNFERALAGDLVVSRGNLKVTRLHALPDWVTRCLSGNQNFYAELEYGEVHPYYDNGVHYYGKKDCDLFMAPRTVTRWVNVFGNSEFIHAGTALHESENDAKQFSIKSSNYIRTAPITWEE